MARSVPIRFLFGAAAFVFACGSVRADMVSSYFPPGMPGYGTEPGVTVATRARADYSNPGTRLGSFLLHSTLDEGFGYDSNIAGSPSQRGSWVIGTRPSLLLDSDWSRDRMGAFLSADDRHALDQPSQSRTDWTGSLAGILDVGRDEVTMAVAHLALHQDRTELAALPSDAPIAYTIDDVRISYRKELNRLSVTPDLEFSSYRFADTTIGGAFAPQRYRDRNVLQGAVTGRYGVTPQQNLVVVVRALGAHYIAPQPGAPTRDSTGYQVLAGIADDADPVWRYRALLGWEMRDFAASQFKAHQAPIAEAALIWSPSGVATITASLTRSIEDAAQEGVAGYTLTSAKLVLDYEYRRNVLLQGLAELQHATFLPAGGTATWYSLGANATWLLNRHVRLIASYDFSDQHSPNSATLQTGGSYTRSIALLTLRLGL